MVRETVQFVDLENIDLPNFAGKLIAGEGYVRLRIDGTGPLSGNSSHTQTFGWFEKTHLVQHETASDPFVKEDLFSGRITAVETAGNTIDLSDSVGNGSISTAIDEAKEYYVEVVAGDHEGHRFEIDEAATLQESGKILRLSSETSGDAGEADYHTDALEDLPDLAGDALVLREHRTLSELCPPSRFTATNTSESADRLLFLNDSNSFDILWMYDGSVHDHVHRWVERRTVTYADEGASRLIRPCDAFYLNPRGGTATLLYLGAVRENQLVCPLKAGWNFVGNPWPRRATRRTGSAGGEPGRFNEHTGSRNDQGKRLPR